MIADLRKRSPERLVFDVPADIDEGEITVYSGNYDFYAKERTLRESQREAAYARQQAMLQKEQRFIERFATHAAKAAQVQSRIKELEKIAKDGPTPAEMEKELFRRAIAIAGREGGGA